MASRNQNRVRDLIRRNGVIRTAEVQAEGIHRKYLAELVRSGEIERIGRGLYRREKPAATEHQTLIEVCKAVPHGVVCLFSALAFHKMTTQNPPQVWLAIERNARRPKILTPKLRVVRMSETAFRTGVERRKVGRAEVRVFSEAKTVVDCFKWRNLVGLDVALEALREFVKRRGRRAAELYGIAQACRVSSVMRPYLEATLG